MATYYIDALNGNDTTGNGSSSTPWQTIAKFFSSCANGDTCKLRGSSTAANTFFYGTGLTTSKTNLTLEPDTGHTPVVAASYPKLAADWSKTDGYTNVYECSYTQNQCYVVWNGATALTSRASIALVDANANSFYFDNAGDKLYINVSGVPGDIQAIAWNQYTISPSGTGFTARGIRFWYFYNANLEIKGTNATVDGCDFRYCTSGAATAFCAIYVNSTGCTVKNCYFSAVNPIGTASSANGITVTNCTAYGGTMLWAPYGTHNMYDCVVTYGSMGNASGSAVINCWRGNVFNSGHDAFQAADTSTINLYYCIMNWDANAPASGTGTSYGVVFHSGGSAYHCVVANLKRSTTGSTSSSCGYNCATLGAQAVILKNCIAYNCVQGIGDTSDTNPPTGWDADYNCIAACDTPYDDGYGAGAHDIASDPLFKAIAPGLDDFRLLPNSPCIDAGLAIAGINEGYRGAAPDIGAFEYVKPLLAHRHN